MKKLILVTMLLLTGCASYGLNGACVHGSNTKATIPYGGGEGNGDIFFCHEGCFGLNCGKPDTTAFANQMSEYIKNTVSDNKMTTSGPGTITFTPMAK